MIWWRGAGKALPSGRFDLAYTLRGSHFRGQRENLVEWLDWRESDATAIELRDEEPQLEIISYTYSLNARRDLARARQLYPDAPVWVEGAQIDDALTRLRLRPCETLIVWTIPASLSIWQAALETANPSRLVAFAARPAWSSVNPFLARLYGMAKYAIAHEDGIADEARMAAALGHRALAVRAGLRLLAGQGRLARDEFAGGRMKLRLAESAPDDAECDKWRARLTLILRETRAYRDYWRREIRPPSVPRFAGATPIGPPVGSGGWIVTPRSRLVVGARRRLARKSSSFRHRRIAENKRNPS